MSHEKIKKLRITIFGLQFKRTVLKINRVGRHPCIIWVSRHNLTGLACYENDPNHLTADWRKKFCGHVKNLSQ